MHCETPALAALGVDIITRSLPEVDTCLRTIGAGVRVVFEPVPEVGMGVDRRGIGRGCGVVTIG
jgi:hypothetical protein